MNTTALLHRFAAGFIVPLVLFSAAVAAAADPADTRTREEVEALIQKEGRTPPVWFAATKLNYPATLDLSWPAQPPERKRLLEAQGVPDSGSYLPEGL